MTVKRAVGHAPAVLAVLVSLVAAGQASATAPNILIFVTDDQRSGLTAMPLTRQLFSHRGVTYKRAYATDPLCCPSRASIMTGRYPHNTGVKSNKDHPGLGVGGASALDQFTTIQRYLHDAGYTTGLFGKYLNRWDLSRPPPFFDRFAVVGTEYSYVDSLVSVGDAGEAPNVFVSETYNTTFVRRQALRFLRRHTNGSEPLFLIIAPHAPHRPFTAEEKYAQDGFGRWAGNPAVFEQDRSDKPAYVQERSATIGDGRKIRTRQYRTLESVDDLVGAIFDQLRSTGQSRNTLAFFVSDNGFLWGEHGLLGKDVPYLPSVRVPFFARWPEGPLIPGSADARGAANVDVAPTIMQAAGLSIPAGQPPMDGRSLLEPWARLREETEHWCNVDTCLYWAAEKTQAYHYIEYYDGPDFAAANVIFREYYDLLADPFELENLLNDGDPTNDPDFSAAATQLALDRDCAGSSCP
jgi:arylsulfatase A-like enzyme